MSARATRRGARPSAPWFAALAAIGAFAACSAAPTEPAEAAAARLAAARSEAVSGSFVEQAVAESFSIEKSRRTAVDANSDLVLTFAEQDGLSPTASAYLDQVRQQLERVVAAGTERAEILTELATLKAAPQAERDPEQIDALAQRSADVGKAARELIAAMQALGFGEDDVFDALDAAADSADAEGGFRTLGALLAERQREILAHASARAAKATQLEVAVQAFLDSVGKERRQLHVENYDTLPAGEYNPIPRFSTDMTPAERARFRLELQESQAWANAIRKLQNGTLQPSLRALRDQLQAMVRDLGDDFETTLRGALAGATLEDAVRTRLEGLLTPVTERIATIRAAVRGWQTFLDQIGSELQLATGFELLEARIAATEQAITAAGELPGVVATLAQDSAIPNELATLLATTGEGALGKLLAAAQARIPQIRELVGATRNALGGLLANRRPAEPKEAPPELWRVLSEAPEARVELARAGVTVGDAVVVKAMYRTQGTDEPRQTDTYKTDIQRMGWHRQISAELTFARADTGSGSAKEWRPGVAAVADLHYRYRDDTDLRAVWNFCDPAFGVHLASLNQTDESAEFGMGGTFSMFGGFITSGIGWNFSAERSDGLYYFLGIDLFTVLESARGLGQ